MILYFPSAYFQNNTVFEKHVHKIYFNENTFIGILIKKNRLHGMDVGGTRRNSQRGL